jgi:hypothetical protein
LIGFPIRVLGSAGLIFMADRKIQQGLDVAVNKNEIVRLRNDLEAPVENFNMKIAGGKWNRMMPGLVTGKDLTKWSSQVRWPWGENLQSTNFAKLDKSSTNRNWRDAATADKKPSASTAHWNIVEGLGPSGHAVALQPATLNASWKENDTSAPMLKYNFKFKGGDAEVFIDFLPTFRIYPGMKLRVAASVDNQPATIVEVPGSSGAENETGTVRSVAVQNNYTRARIQLSGLAAGKHTFTIRAIDPGAVIDRVSLP